LIVPETREIREGESPPIPRGISHRKPIQAAKEAVTVEELAEKLSGRGVRRGKEMLFRCPLHDDHNPSLRVDTAKQVWHCFPCAVGGDVVELARRAWGHPDDGRGMADAAGYLLLEFGHEVPQRPPSWYARQDRQGPIRDGIDQMRVRRLQNALYGMVEPFVVDERDAERTWAECWALALEWYERIRSEREEAEHG
jgi:hypothetical protein